MGVGEDPHKTRGDWFGWTRANRDTSLRTTLIGLGFGPGCYDLSFPIPWRNINPLIPLYTHSAPWMAGRALYGGSPGAANAG